MRILHTSDWHLNDRLYRVKRQPDIAARLAEIASYLDERQVDVMIVSGDIFSTFNRLDEVRDALHDVHRIFKPFLLRGGTIIGISGNHDSEPLFDLLRDTLDLASPQERQHKGARPCGRLYMATRPTHLLLKDSDGQQVQFVLMPYPTPAAYLQDNETKWSSKEEMNRLLHAAMQRKLEQIKTKAIDSRLPSVLVAHAHIRGSEIHNLYHLTESDDVVFDMADLPTSWAYAAYGHIHKPQPMHSANHIRYAGSIDRMDFGEINDKEKSVVLVEIGAQGRIGEPEMLPLDATPLYRVEIRDPETELPQLREQYPDAARAIVDFKAYYQPGKHNPHEIRRELETIFPRWCRGEVISESTAVNQPNAAPPKNLRDVGGTVRSFLQERLQDHANRDELLALAEQLLVEDSSAETSLVELEVGA